MLSGPFGIEFQTEEEAREYERSPSVALLCAGLPVTTLISINVSSIMSIKISHSDNQFTHVLSGPFGIEFQTEQEAREKERSPSVALLCAGLPVTSLISINVSSIMSIKISHSDNQFTHVLSGPFGIELQTEVEAREYERSPSVALLCAGLPVTTLISINVSSIMSIKISHSDNQFAHVLSGPFS